MAEDKLIVVLGITGQQGGSVGRVFNDEPGWRVRGVTRNPSQHPLLEQQGIELVAANYDDPPSLETAFGGANAIFAVTDFWQFLKDPATFTTAEQTGNQPNEIAMAREIQHGKNIIHAASKHLATLGRFVLSTESDAKKWSNGDTSCVFHFDGKAEFERYLKQNFKDLAAKTSYLQIGSYLTNRTSKYVAPQRQEDGSFIIRRLGIAGGKPLPYVHPPNDTGHFVRALVLSEKAPAGSTMLGGCEMLTNEEFCELWGQVNGAECRFEALTYEDAIKTGMQEWLAREVSDSGLYTTKYGWDGGDPEVKRPEELGVDMSKLMKVEDWIRNEDWSEVL